MTRIAGFVLSICLALAGCAGYGPTPALVGQDRQAVIALLGKPATERSTTAGLRLEYPKGPMGRQTYFVYLDSNQRVSRWEQVLTESNFAKILPGMPAAVVEELIGKSLVINSLARDRGEVWSYRFETSFCIWFQIEMTKEGTVRSAGYGIPPECRQDRDASLGRILG